MLRKRLGLMLTALAVAAALVTPLALARGDSAAATSRVDVQIIDFSDWHGQLDPLSVNGVNVGGAAELSSYFKADRATNPNTLTLTAGDAFGGTPPLSFFFNDEPAVLAMNLMGVQVDTLGNHNFDHGLAYLQHLVNLADFPYVSADLANLSGNLTGVDPWRIFTVGGVKIGVVGITNPEAPTLVFPGNFGSIVITDPVSAANKARARAQAAGAKITVAITHLGVESFDPSTGAPQGPLVDFANAVGGFDVIFGDHTDVQYSGVLNGHLVVENRSKGATYSKVHLEVDPKNGRIVSADNTFVVPVSSAVTPDSAIVNLLAPFRAQLSAIFDGTIGVATGVFVRGGNIERRQEVPIGDLFSDAIRLRYGTQLGLTNGGGIRAPLPSSYAPADHTLRRTSAGYAAGPPYDLVVGDVFTTLPFGNVVVTRTVTGAQLYAMLENGVSQIAADGAGAAGRFPQISGFKFTFHYLNPVGSRVTDVGLSDGTPILSDSTTYTLATNDFVNAGGDGYTMLADGQGTTREVMADVVLDYIRSLGTITPTTDGRITKLP